MEIAVLLVFAAIAGIVGAGVHLARQSARRRSTALREVVRSRDWDLTGRDDELVARWRGEPFRPGLGHARTVVRGGHRGRDFVAFEYVYSAKPTPNADTAITHRFAVWTLPLPSPVPSLSVTGRQVLGPTVTKLFGASHVSTTDSQFDQMFAVDCADELFVARVLQPPLLEYLRQTGPWNWRFEDDTMISFEKGRLDAAGIAARLDLMAGVLERVSADVWRQH